MSLDEEEAREVYSVLYMTEPMTKYKLKRQSLNGGEQGSTGILVHGDSRPELVDGSVIIDRKINNDNFVNAGNSGFGFAAMAA